jgi:hypothetical protein
MPEVKLDTVDAAELAEMLQLVSRWLTRDPERLGGSLAQFIGHPAYGLDGLRDDLEGSSCCSAAATVSPSSAPEASA